jgi:hypothetical protein
VGGRSVAARPVVRPSTPEAMSSGRSLPASTSPNASITERSVSAAAPIWEKSWL